MILGIKGAEGKPRLDDWKGGRFGLWRQKESVNEVE